MSFSRASSTSPTTLTVAESMQGISTGQGLSPARWRQQTTGWKRSAATTDVPLVFAPRVFAPRRNRQWWFSCGSPSLGVLQFAERFHVCAHFTLSASGTIRCRRRGLKGEDVPRPPARYCTSYVHPSPTVVRPFDDTARKSACFRSFVSGVAQWWG